MGKEQDFNRVKLFAGVIYKAEERYQAIKKKLTYLFSEIDVESSEIPFDSTDYYTKEMGSPLMRRFFSFKELISPVQLPGIKRITNRIETESSINDKRSVNIDPGYLSEANVIIATTKNYYHRVPLQDGIYAHMEFTLKKNRVTPLPWTYPDFHKPEYQEFFNQLCLMYKQTLKEG